MPVNIADLVGPLPSGGEDLAAVARDDDRSAALLDRLSSVLAPDFECRMRFANMNPVTYRGGPEALRSAWLDRLKYWAEYRIEVEGVVDAGERIVVFHHARARSIADETETVVHVAAIWTVRDCVIDGAEFNVPQEEARSIAYRAIGSQPGEGRETLG